MNDRAAPSLSWDLFCRVVDNYGDLGVCWRLARDLARHGQRVRLWIDDPALSRRMTLPEAGVECIDWCEPVPDLMPSDVVVEAFGCDPPDRFVERMAAQAADRTARDRPPVWINLEYLSAEPYVRRSHGLPSPQGSGPGRGLTKWFFYPGFVEGTGGLILEAGLLERRAHFDRRAWLNRWGALPPDCRHVSLFAYETAAVEDLLEGLLDGALDGLAGGLLDARYGLQDPHPVHLWVAHGPLQARVHAWLQARPQAARRLGMTALPWLSQDEFDHLLWSCDLNLVRGEDSLVRAIWAGVPFLWQLYPQWDGAHAAKLEAFLNLWDAPGEAKGGWKAAWRRWNGLQAGPLTLGPATDEAAALRARALQSRLAARPSLTRELLEFAVGKLQ